MGYDINRAAPLIAGVDRRLDNGIVAGVAATYVATSVSFKDGTRTECELEPGRRLRRLGGWAVVALGSVVASFNDFAHLAALTARPSGDARYPCAFKVRPKSPSIAIDTLPARRERPGCRNL